jgi:hypothetical protein
MPEPSLRYEIVSIHDEMRHSRIEYILGRNSRSEARNCNGYCDGDPNQPGAVTRYRYGPLHTHIQNRDLHYHFQLDLESGVYTASRVNEYGSPSWVKPKTTKPQPSGRTVYVHMQTVDTGERREMYRHTARRVITRTTQRVSPESDCGPSETEVDGWYIDPPAAWLTLYPPHPGSYAILCANGQFDKPVFTHDGPREMGFPMFLARTYRSNFTDAEGNVRDHTFVSREEVTEFSEESLAYDLFVPPKDFHRVLQLPGGMPLPFALRMRLGWEKLRDTFVSKR